MRTKALFLNLIFLLIMSLILSAEEKDPTNPWRKFFPDHLETVYIIMKDGKRIKHTSQSDIMIDMSIGRLEETLRKIKGKDYSIKKIKIVIHNHRWKNSFSRSDYKQYWTLKSFGFDGRFLLYCHRTKKVYDIKDKESPKEQKALAL